LPFSKLVLISAHTAINKNRHFFPGKVVAKYIAMGLSLS